MHIDWRVPLHLTVLRRIRLVHSLNKKNIFFVVSAEAITCEQHCSKFYNFRILASKRVRKSSKNRLVHLLANEMSEPCSARAWNRPLTSLTVFSRKFCIIDFPEISGIFLEILPIDINHRQKRIIAQISHPSSNVQPSSLFSCQNIW